MVYVQSDQWQPIKFLFMVVTCAHFFGFGFFSDMFQGLHEFYKFIIKEMKGRVKAHNAFIPAKKKNKAKNNKFCHILIRKNYTDYSSASNYSITIKPYSSTTLHHLSENVIEQLTRMVRFTMTC